MKEQSHADQYFIFCSIPVEDMKTDHSIIIYKTTTHPTELDLSYLHTFAHSDKAQYFQERYHTVQKL